MVRASIQSQEPVKGESWISIHLIGQTHPTNGIRATTSFGGKERAVIFPRHQGFRKVSRQWLEEKRIYSTYVLFEGGRAERNDIPCALVFFLYVLWRVMIFLLCVITPASLRMQIIVNT